MIKLAGSLVTLVLGAVVLGLIAPGLARLAAALTGPIVAAGLIAAILRVVWFLTR